MDCIEAILGRRSIRRYTGEEVGSDVVESLLRAAMAAPSAGNQQSWRFIVVRDRTQLELLSKATPYSGMLADAPLGIVVCGDTREEKHPGYWVQDCSAAVENLLLAVHASGLGAVWIGVHPIQERADNVREACSVPEGVEPFCMVALGLPQEAKPPGERYRKEFVFADRWE